MKKIMIPVLICLFSFGILNAKTIEKENNIVKTVTYDISPLCKLIQKGDLEAVKTLIESGEDVNKRSKGLTPLMFAARYNKAGIAKLLIKNGAKLKSRSSKNNLTALAMAKKFKAVDVIKVIEAAY